MAIPFPSKPSRASKMIIDLFYCFDGVWRPVPISISEREAEFISGLKHDSVIYDEYVSDVWDEIRKASPILEWLRTESTSKSTADVMDAILNAHNWKFK